MGGGVQARVAIAETDRRVPHLQIQERRALSIVEVRTFTSGEKLRLLHVVHGVAVGTIRFLQGA